MPAPPPLPPPLPSPPFQAEPAATGPAAPEQVDWRIEGLRAIAAMMVMAVHYLGHFDAGRTPLVYLFTGVDLFFVLSGYVFAPYLLEARPLHSRAFFIRRFFRLFPLYLLSLAAYAVFKWGDPALGPILLRHVFMAHTLESREIAFYFNAAYWSLPPEVEFYLLLPAFAWLCARRGGFATLAVIAVLARVLVTVNMPANYADTTPANIAVFHLPGLLVEFLSGAGAWWCANRLRGDARVTGAMLLLAGLLLSWVWAKVVVGRLFAGGDQLLHTDPLTRGNVPMVAALGYALVVAGALRLVPVRGVPAALQRAALWAGGCSYAVYLMHTLAPHVVQAVVPAARGPMLGVCAVVVTVVVAAVLHRTFEDPLRRFGRRIARGPG